MGTCLSEEDGGRSLDCIEIKEERLSGCGVRELTPSYCLEMTYGSEQTSKALLSRLWIAS